MARPPHHPWRYGTPPVDYLISSVSSLLPPWPVSPLLSPSAQTHPLSQNTVLDSSALPTPSVCPLSDRHVIFWPRESNRYNRTPRLHRAKRPTRRLAVP